MDDFEYSFQISEQDWDSFFQACEECNMLPPGLAGLDDSGMSDIDDLVNQHTQTATQTTSHDPGLQTDGPPDCQGSPVEHYLSKYGLNSPEQILSGSEDDFHLEAVNVFFERLKSVSVTEDHPSLESKMAGHSEGTNLIEDSEAIAASVEKSPSYINPMAHINYYQRSTDDDLDREIHKCPCPDTEPFIKEEDWSLDVLKEGDKWQDRIKRQADIEKSPCDVLVKGKELTDPNQVREANSQLVTSNNSDLLTVQGHTTNVTPRKRRKKKKRISAELVDTDPEYEAQLPSKVRDSDEDTNWRRGHHLAEYCSSGTASEVCYAPHDFITNPMKHIISKNFSIEVKGDNGTSTLRSTDLQKEHSKSVVRDAQSKIDMENMSDSYLTGKPAETGQLGMTAALKYPEPGVSVTETPQSHVNLSAHTNADNVANHLQLNNLLPSEKLASIAISDVSSIEKKPVSIESLDTFLISHQTDDAEAQTSSAALQVAHLIPSHNVVYSKAPKSEFENTETLSDFQFDGFSAVGQRKTSVSCETFPELTDKTFFSTFDKNAEKKESLSSVTHDEVPYVHISGDLSAKKRMSLTCEADVNMVEISHQNGHMTPIIASQIPKADDVNDAPSVELKPELTNQELSEQASISNAFVNSQTEDRTEENSQSFQLKNMPESEKDIHLKVVEIQSPGIKVDRNDELSHKGHTNDSQSMILTTEPDSQLSDDSKAEPTLSNNQTNSEEQKCHILGVDTPPCFPSKDHDLSPSTVVQHPPSPPHASTGGPKSLQMAEPSAVSQPTPPVYAISSFWNEMEKLTINDILQLRLVGQVQHPRILLQPEESNMADVADAADSGYFTHSDESKPDLSSGNTSFVSDIDGELAPLICSDAAKLDEGRCESHNPTGMICESDTSMSGTATGMEDVFNSDAAHLSPSFSNNTTRSFRKMCKNISVQNLRALESQNLGKILRNASFHSIQSVHSTHSTVEVVDDYVDPFDRVETSSPVYLSDDDEEMDSTGITFSEIFEYLFGTDEPKKSASEADTVAASFLSESVTCVPEMYEHFFSEFEPQSFFYPLTEDNSSTNDELVPIFSSSRSSNRNVQFPEVYDYFFPDDSPVHSDEDEDPEHTVIQVVTPNDHIPTKSHDSVSASDPFKDFSPEKDNSWNFPWTNLFSLRRVHHKGFTVPREESSSQALTPVKNTNRSFRGGINPINILGADGSPFPDPLILNLESCIFRQLAAKQTICNEMQAAVADPRLDGPLLPIKQADMCLVCIAFASWVLKSVNPEGADTWKAVVLANISALSAIRYLRRFTRDEAAKISPLRQIKPA